MYQIDEVKEIGSSGLYQDCYRYIEVQITKKLSYRTYGNIFGHSVNLVLSTVIERMSDQTEEYELKHYVSN